MEPEKVSYEIESYGFRKTFTDSSKVIFTNDHTPMIEIILYKGKVFFMYHRLYEDGVEVFEGLESGAFKGFMDVMPYYSIEVKRIIRLLQDECFTRGTMEQGLVGWLAENGFFIKTPDRSDRRLSYTRDDAGDVFMETTRDPVDYRLYFNSLDMSHPRYIQISQENKQYFSHPVSATVTYWTIISRQLHSAPDRLRMFKDTWAAYETHRQDSIQRLLNTVLVKEER